MQLLLGTYAVEFDRTGWRCRPWLPGHAKSGVCMIACGVSLYSTIIVHNACVMDGADSTRVLWPTYLGLPATWLQLLLSCAVLTAQPRHSPMPRWGY